MIWADDDIADAGLHASFKLDADGEEIGLFDSDGITLIDSVTFDDQTDEASPMVATPMVASSGNHLPYPSPGTANVGLYDGFVSDVEFSHERGFYDVPFSVTLATETNGAIIYYTLDGSDPYAMAGRSATGRVYVGFIIHRRHHMPAGKSNQERVETRRHTGPDVYFPDRRHHPEPTGGTVGRLSQFMERIPGRLWNGPADMHRPWTTRI